jgi:hypothetical protein
MIGRNRRARLDQSTAERHSIEFAELLDEVVPAVPNQAHASIAELVMFPISSRPSAETPGEFAATVPSPGPQNTSEGEQESHEAAVSRFAGAGTDDDRLPVPAQRTRRFKR